MPKYRISAPLFDAILAGRKEEKNNFDLDDLYGEVLKRFKELGLKDHTASSERFTFETDNLEEAKEIQKKLQTVVNQLTAEFPETPDWIKDCVEIDTQPE